MEGVGAREDGREREGREVCVGGEGRGRKRECFNVFLIQRNSQEYVWEGKDGKGRGDSTSFSLKGTARIHVMVVLGSCSYLLSLREQDWYE